MLFAFLSGIAGALFGLSYKVRAAMRLDYRIVLLLGAAWSLLMSLGGVLYFGEALYSTAAFLVGIPYGATITISMIIYFRVVERTKLNTSWTFVQLSVVVPFALSVVAYGEKVTWREALGVALIFLTIILLGLGRSRARSTGKIAVASPAGTGRLRRSSGRRNAIALVASFLLTGLAQCFAKFYEALPGKQPTVTMLLYVSVGMLAGSIVAYYLPPRKDNDRERSPALTMIFFSFSMSAARLLAPLFLLLALQAVKGAVVFPLRTMINIVLLVLLSYLIYGEKLKLTEALGVPVAIAAITLLTV